MAQMIPSEISYGRERDNDTNSWAEKKLFDVKPYLNTPADYRSGGFLLPRCSLFPATCRRRQRLLAPQAFQVRTVPALPLLLF